MKFIKIEPKSVELLWPLVKDLIQKPVDRNLGEFNIDDVYYSVDICIYGLLEMKKKLWLQL